MTDMAIEIHDLHKTYSEGFFVRRSVEALRGVSLEVERGSIFGLLGPNGAGKTTLIKILLGIVRKSQGDASLLGKPAGSRQSRRAVGFLPENHRIPRHLTGNTALDYYGGLSYLSRREIRKKAPALLERVGLGSWGTTPVKNYSKGMMQRLGLAQAMIHDPDLLILDEPTDGVDPVGRMDMRVILQELKEEGKTIFLNSHMLQEIELVCDRVAILAKGELRRIGTIDEVTRTESDLTRLVLVSQEEPLRSALEGVSIEKLVVLSPETVEIGIRAMQQKELDQCIDRLRQHEIGIQEITRPRATLETAFLDIIRQLDDEDAAPPVIDLDPTAIVEESTPAADIPGEPPDPDEN
jgi:ABC-2 type transport system ATP-binding protein